MKDYFEIARRWAPIHYQYIDQKNLGRDLICKVNFDSDWDTSNNRENSKRISKNPENLLPTLVPTVYFSVADTPNHYFLLYSFYHADDKKHENDLEGCLLIVEKGDSANKDRLMGMITIAHLFFHKYSYKNRLETKIGSTEYMPAEIEDDEIVRPLVEQEKADHGLYALSRRDFFGRIFFLINGTPWYDIVACYPPNNRKQEIEPYEVERFSEVKETPHFPTFYYQLIDMTGPQGLWNQRSNPDTFKDSRGIFNTRIKGEAHAPWYWDTKFDSLPPGSIWTEPARLVYEYFEVIKGKPIIYDKNKYEKFMYEPIE